MGAAPPVCRWDWGALGRLGSVEDFLKRSKTPTLFHLISNWVTKLLDFASLS
jgi:hypothetical protein